MRLGRGSDAAAPKCTRRPGLCADIHGQALPVLTAAPPRVRAWCVHGAALHLLNVMAPPLPSPSCPSQIIGTLEEVHMPQNGINHPGVTALAQAFAINPLLRIINLNDNTFTEKGAVAMAQVRPVQQGQVRRRSGPSRQGAAASFGRNRVSRWLLCPHSRPPRCVTPVGPAV